MSEEKGIKETKEVLIAGMELSTFLLERLKDGAQLSDATALIAKLTTDEEFKQKIQDGMDKMNEVPAEVKNISWTEGLELVKVGFDYTPGFIEAVTK